MCVAYSESSSQCSQKMSDSACLEPLEQAESLELGSMQEASSCGSESSGTTAGGKAKSRKAASTRTPQASEPLFSMGGFVVADVDELRRLMHESLKGFAVEMGVQIASQLLEEDVVRLCGVKNSRDRYRENHRHGSQPGYVILGGQKVAVRRSERPIRGQVQLCSARGLLNMRH